MGTEGDRRAWGHSDGQEEGAAVACHLGQSGCEKSWVWRLKENEISSQFSWEQSLHCDPPEESMHLWSSGLIQAIKNRVVLECR